jgi:hypothetical protein
VPDPADSAAPDPLEVDGEVVPSDEDGRPLPALAEIRSVELARPEPVSVPAAVAAATGGFLLGVAAFMLVRVLRRPKPARLSRAQAKRRGKRGREVSVVDIAATRSFLVDVHILRDR